MKFSASLCSTVPIRYTAEIEVEADTPQEARKKIIEMYDKDLIEFEEGEKDFDEAKLSMTIGERSEP